eukprot:GEMP01043424.1.p1 GENE.GEMP01043424.1~~GEMP01043424.1.p1  ORF type:complete len:372 (+),score=79.75 GEMP01043424.1:124-1239(+)
MARVFDIAAIAAVTLANIHDHWSFETFHDIRQASQTVKLSMHGMHDSWTDFATDARFAPVHTDSPLDMLSDISTHDNYTVLGILRSEPPMLFVASTHNRTAIIDASRILRRAGTLVTYDANTVVLREDGHIGFYQSENLSSLDIKLQEIDNFESMVLTPRFVFAVNGSHLGHWYRDGRSEPIVIQASDATKIDIGAGGRPVLMAPKSVMWLYPEPQRGIRIHACPFEADGMVGPYFVKDDSVLEMDETCKIQWKTPRIPRMKQVGVLGMFVLALANNFFTLLSVEDARRGYGSGASSVIRHRWDAASSRSLFATKDNVVLSYDGHSFALGRLPADGFLHSVDWGVLSEWIRWSRPATFLVAILGAVWWSTR